MYEQRERERDSDCFVQIIGLHTFLEYSGTKCHARWCSKNMFLPNYLNNWLDQPCESCSCDSTTGCKKLMPSPIRWAVPAAHFFVLADAVQSKENSYDMKKICRFLWVIIPGKSHLRFGKIVPSKAIRLKRRQTFPTLGSWHQNNLDGLMAQTETIYLFLILGVNNPNCQVWVDAMLNLYEGNQMFSVTVL